MQDRPVEAAVDGAVDLSRYRGWEWDEHNCLAALLATLIHERRHP
jgi:hypothetical protein